VGDEVVSQIEEGGEVYLWEGDEGIVGEVKFDQQVDEEEGAFEPTERFVGEAVAEGVDEFEDGFVDDISQRERGVGFGEIGDQTDGGFEYLLVLYVGAEDAVLEELEGGWGEGSVLGQFVLLIFFEILGEVLEGNEGFGCLEEGFPELVE
jgi:hypothetical protein